MPRSSVTAATPVAMPRRLRVLKNGRSACRKGTMSWRTEMSPPLAARTLLVRLLLTIRLASCSATMAMTPTAMQKMANTVRWPPRRSERVG